MSSSLSIPHRYAILAAIALGFAFAPPLPGQDLYTLESGSELSFGCTGPSPCACPVAVIGPATGSFELALLPPPLGPIFDYTISNFTSVTVHPDGTLTTIEGSGTFTIDLVANTQQLTLDVTLNGVPAVFESMGAVPLVAPFPGSIEIDVFHMQNTCIYDGLHIVAVGPPPPGAFIRGDVNEDGNIDVSDAIAALLLLFPPSTFDSDCPDARDVNDDGTLNIADPIHLLQGLFAGGASPPPPFPGCGPDPTDDALGCAGHNACP